MTGWGVDAMLWTAERVAALPGAVLRIPAMPTAAFLLMIAGGLWLALWQTRWRLAGAALIAAGLALAPTLRLPDLLVGRDGALVAVREEGGQLSAVGGGRASFELGRWLEHDGDQRTREGSGQGCRLPLRCSGLPDAGQGIDGAVATAPRGIRRRLPSRQHPRCLHRQPEELLGAEGCRRLLRRAPRGHARALHRG